MVGRRIRLLPSLTNQCPIEFAERIDYAEHQVHRQRMLASKTHAFFCPV